MASITDLISSASVTPSDEGSGCYVRLAHQVSADDYRQFKTLAEMAGGRYVSKDRGHLFALGQDKVVPALTKAAERMADKQKLNDQDFFPTPEKASDDAVLNMAVQCSGRDFESLLEDESCRILEPSAGDGALVDAVYRYAKEKGVAVKCQIVLAEIDPLRCDTLRAKYADRPNVNVVEGDFLSLSPDDLGDFRFCLMNPPFTSSGGWDEHVRHAQRFMRSDDGGQKIMSCVLPNLVGVAQISRNSPKKDLAIDLMTLCAAGGYGNREELDKNAFLKHGAKRGSAIKTGTNCDLVCFEVFDTKNNPEFAFDVFDKAMVVLENTQSFYKRMGDLLTLHKDDPMAYCAAIKEDIQKSRVDLIVKDGACLHSDLVDVEALAAAMTLSSCESFEIAIPDTERSALIATANRPKAALDAYIKERERAREQARPVKPVTNQFDF